MVYFIYGILFIVVVLPIIQELTRLVVTLLDNWETIIAVKTTRMQAELEKEQALTQLEFQERQMEGQEHSPAIGFHVYDQDAIEMEEEE